ncbi:hypothetical protein SRHO_G00299170 [Serrasalmus rhombeus]
MFSTEDLVEVLRSPGERSKRLMHSHRLQGVIDTVPAVAYALPILPTLKDIQQLVTEAGLTQTSAFNIHRGWIMDLFKIRSIVS